MEQLMKSVVETVSIAFPWFQALREDPDLNDELAKLRAAEPKIFGRDEELDKLIRLIGVPLVRNNGTGSMKRAKKEKGVEYLARSSGVKKKENVSVLPIVGIGGVGKTTLAQMVCENKMVKSYFELIIWVCVSDNFDVARLTKEIIFCATKQEYTVDNLDVLQVTLKNALESRKFLLVLDDIWSESKEDWHRLFSPLKDACEGSMVIVTTRSKKVAEITGTVSMGPIILKGLKEKVYWEFFKSYAFHNETKLENYLKLEEIGKQIVVKLKGSPLAAKTLGSLLNTNLHEMHWRNIRDSEIWALQQKEHGILPVIQLSYQYLPSHLKKLFSFCSLFPKDYLFSENELIHLWICEGFIDPQQKQQMEIIANGYFRDLVSRCFFQQVPNSFLKYGIHDLIHDVAQSITKDECFCIENEDFEKKISENIRHLSVVSECKLKVNKLMELRKCKKLHSITIQKVSMRGFKAIETWFNECSNICSLSIAGCKIKNLPENIGNLNHLRSLDISYTKIKQLPNSFGYLYKLEYFNMKACYDFQRFPEVSNRLISMKLLILPGHIAKKISLVGHIPNLANAIQLDYLKFVVMKKKGIEIGSLKHITKIYNTLEITHLEEVSNRKEAEQAQVNNKKFLNGLILSWQHFPSINSIRTESDQEVLEGMCPHQNLEELQICNYGGEFMPSWLKTEKLNNLTSVSIRKCGIITIIPSLPCSITKLVIMACKRLTSVQNCLVPSKLPLLKKLYISGCEELVSVPVERFHEFIYLNELTISDCPVLICPREMILPLSLQKLELDSCGELEEQLSYGLQNLTSLTSLTIRNCPRLTSISLPHHICNLRSLEDLRVGGCWQLESLGGQKFLESLKGLDIGGCPKLEETEGKDRKRTRVQGGEV